MAISTRLPQKDVRQGLRDKQENQELEIQGELERKEGRGGRREVAERTQAELYHTAGLAGLQRHLEGIWMCGKGRECGHEATAAGLSIAWWCLRYP